MKNESPSSLAQEALLWAERIHGAEIPEGKGLVIGGRPGLPGDLDADVWQPFQDLASALGTRVRSEHPVQHSYPWVWVIGCPDWTELRWRIALGWRSLAPGGRLTVASHHQQNGQRLCDLPHQLWEETKKRCRIVAFSAPPEEIESWWNEGQPRRSEASGLISQPGVFGWDKVDKGSALLIELLPQKLPGRVADLGCGYGLLSGALLGRGARELFLYDIDQRAIECTRANLPSQSDCQVHLHWLDLRNAPVQAKLDHVVTNPPFHLEARASVTLGLTFVERAAAALKKGGCLWMVANQALDYESVLAKKFSEHRELGRREGFKVLFARK